MALYENLAYGVNISYPEEWIAQEPDPNDLGIVVGFLAPGEDPNNPQDYVTVQIQSLPADQKITLDQYTQSVIRSLKSSYPDFALLAQANMVLANQPGNVMVYTVTSEKTLYQIMLAETIKENKAYIITYYALADRYSEFENDANRMINSFGLI